MGCPRGGGHRWRQMRAKSGASGFFTLQQCRKCSETRETLHPIIIVLIIIILAVIAAGLYQAGVFDQLQQ